MAIVLELWDPSPGLRMNDALEVVHVKEGGKAEEAGVRVGDRLVAVQEDPVGDTPAAELFDRIRTCERPVVLAFEREQLVTEWGEFPQEGDVSSDVNESNAEAGAEEGNLFQAARSFMSRSSREVLSRVEESTRRAVTNAKTRFQELSLRGSGPASRSASSLLDRDVAHPQGHALVNDFEQWWEKTQENNRAILQLAADVDAELDDVLKEVDEQQQQFHRLDRALEQAIPALERDVAALSEVASTLGSRFSHLTRALEHRLMERNRATEKEWEAKEEAKLRARSVELDGAVARVTQRLAASPPAGAVKASSPTEAEAEEEAETTPKDEVGEEDEEREDDQHAVRNRPGSDEPIAGTGAEGEEQQEETEGPATADDGGAESLSAAAPAREEAAPGAGDAAGGAGAAAAAEGGDEEDAADPHSHSQVQALPRQHRLSVKDIISRYNTNPPGDDAGKGSRDKGGKKSKKEKKEKRAKKSRKSRGEGEGDGGGAKPPSEGQE